MGFRSENEIFNFDFRDATIEGVEIGPEEILINTCTLLVFL